MKKRATLIIVAIFIVLNGLGQTVLATYSNVDDVDVPRLTLFEFLEEIEMGLDDYIAMMAAGIEQGEYLHFLEVNSPRYEAFQARNPNIPFDKVIAYVNVNADKDFYSYIHDVPDLERVCLLVNKNFSLPRDWMPDDFMSIGSGHKMREEAAENFLLLKEAIEGEGLRLNVVASYRAFITQTNTHRNAVARYGSVSADASFARAGHSEHQTGLAVDVLHRSPTGLMINSHFETTPQFEWLKINAHNYGFILRYPNEFREIHGYIFEPWHWRYVGVEIATAMFNEGITLFEEFYGKFLSSDVLYSARERIFEQRAIAEAEELARILAEEEAANNAETQITHEPLPNVGDDDLVIYITPSITEPLYTEFENPGMLIIDLSLLASVICAAIGVYIGVKKGYYKLSTQWISLIKRGGN